MRPAPAPAAPAAPRRRREGREGQEVVQVSVGKSSWKPLKTTGKPLQNEKKIIIKQPNISKKDQKIMFFLCEDVFRRPGASVGALLFTFFKAMGCHGSTLQFETYKNHGKLVTCVTSLY